MESFRNENFIVYTIDQQFKCCCSTSVIGERTSTDSFLMCILIDRDVWSEDLTTTEAAGRWKTLNSHVIVSGDRLLSSVKECMRGNITSHIVDEVTDTLVVTFNFCLDDIFVTWKSHLRRSPPMMLLRHLILPLTLALQESSRRECSMLNLLKKLKGAYTAGNLERGPNGDRIMHSLETVEEGVAKHASVFDCEPDSPYVTQLNNSARALFLEATKKIGCETASDSKPADSATELAEFPTKLNDVPTSSEEQRRAKLHQKIAHQLSKTHAKKKKGILQK